MGDKLVKGAEELDIWLSTQGGSLEELRDRFALVEQARGVRYEGLSDVDRWGSAAYSGIYFFFREGVLTMLFLAGDQRTEQLDPESLMSRLGGPGEMRRSRAGKAHVLHVYPEQGVALSEHDGNTDFVEIYPPTTQQEYETRIYEPPPKFIR